MRVLDLIPIEIHHCIILGNKKIGIYVVHNAHFRDPSRNIETVNANGTGN